MEPTYDQVLNNDTPENKQKYWDVTFGLQAVDNLKPSKYVENLANFASHIWQVHPFYEGNTRTTAVFIEKYLLKLGYEIDNEIFIVLVKSTHKL